MGIAVSYHDTVTKLQELSLPAGGPFDRTDWFALLIDSGMEPVIAVGEGPHRAVVLPLMPTSCGLASLANWFTFTWRPLGRNDEVADEVLHAIARDLRNRTHVLSMAPVPLEGEATARLAASFSKAGWVVFVEQCDENHVLAVEGRSFAEYWAYRSGKMRTTLKRKGRKVDIEIHTHFDEDAWADYRTVYADSWKPEEEREDVLSAFARLEGEAGRIRLGIARVAGKPVAAQFWTVEGGTAYIHKLAHIEDAKPLSAGTTLTAALFEHVIDTDKVELVDFGTGSDSYKRDWMETCRARYRISCYDWRQPKAWVPLVKAYLRRLAPHNRRR